ncbi:MAG: glucosaminidase domain-containing protein [Polyangiaceae bacterium]|nr:glucosaminidase domain-containing protein [Myxococcales bacterium]MCB9587239.1 glucosaminidase domain-containing protein [Polyangiaceae bacterium]MCB9609378.1 glucosaminidase domain-containing protein [Polyangiaceae bacterium]
MSAPVVSVLPSQPAARGVEPPPRVSGTQFADALDRLQGAEPGAAASPVSELTPVRRGEVAAVRTRLSGEQAAEALSSAWESIHGEKPSKETLSILTAQWAHETGRGGSMYNYNFGGIKGSSPEGLSTSLRTREGWGKSEVTIRDSFRAYSTAEAGARDYLELLGARYGSALESAKAGDAEGFVHNLKSRGYFTGNEQAYVRSVSSMSRSALESGFDALGGSAGALQDLSGAAVTYRTAFASGMFPDGLDRLGLGSIGDDARVDAYALADEIGRTALQIARQEHAEAHRSHKGNPPSDDQRPSFLPGVTNSSVPPVGLELV